MGNFHAEIPSKKNHGILQGAAGTLFFDRMLQNFEIPKFWLTTPPTAQNFIFSD
jgi:hypothetical protein